jgi:uncharacterized membrane protein
VSAAARALRAVPFAPEPTPAAGRFAETPLMAAGWRMAAVIAALAGYGLLSHLLMVHAAHAPWAVAVLFGPLVLAVATTGWQRRQPLLLAVCAAGVGVLVWIVTRGGVADINRMYLLQHAGFHAVLAWAFAVTLRPGATPFITTLARGVHGKLRLAFTPEVEAYTRKVTVLWAAYFAGMVVVSVLLYLLAPWSWWSAFANLLTPLSAGLLMVGEHVMRYRWHPDFDRVTLSAAINAYRHSGTAQEPASR